MCHCAPFSVARGYTRFLSRHELLSDGFLGEEDTLTVRVDVHLWKHTSPYSLLDGCAARVVCSTHYDSSSNLLAPSDASFVLPLTPVCRQAG